MKKEDRRIRKTKKLLKENLIKMLISGKNLSGISVSELTQTCDISRGTFYLHYSDIYSLAEEIENDLLNEFEEKVNCISVEELRQSAFEFIRVVIDFAYDNRELCAVFMAGNVDMSFIYKVKQVIKNKFLSNWKSLYTGTDQNTAERYFNFIFAGALELVSEWIEKGMKESANELAELIEYMIMNGTEILGSRI